MPDASPGVATPVAEDSGSVLKAYDDQTHTISTVVGERFVIRLPANITTPYKWLVVEDASATVFLAERHYQDKPPPDCQNCVGYPGTDSLVFEARSPGTTKLTLRYAPLRSEADPSDRKVSIQVTVDQRKTGDK